MIFLRPLFRRACVYSTFFTVAICLVGLLDGNETASIRLSDYLWVLLFCLILAVANGILSLTKIPRLPRRLTHYALCLGSFIALALVTERIPKKGSSLLIFFVVFTAVYALIFFLRKLYFRLRRWILKE